LTLGYVNAFFLVQCEGVPDMAYNTNNTTTTTTNRNTNNVPTLSFESVLEDFKKDLLKSGLKRRDIDNFKFTTFEELEKCIGELQTEQHAQRRVQNLNRLKPFLEVIKQYGEVVDLFCNVNEMVAFIWVSTN
jgi:hypothetical protein